MSTSSDPTKLAEWRKRLARFSSCGLAVAPFCSREGVSAALFYYWRKKLGANGRRGPRPLLGPRGRRRCMADGRPRHRSKPTGGRGVFQQVAVVAARPVAVRGAPAVVPPGRRFVPAASTWVPAGRTVCIQMPCGTRIEVGAEDLDALRAVITEVVHADRAWEASRRADSGREVSVARC